MKPKNTALIIAQFAVSDAQAALNYAEGNLDIAAMDAAANRVAAAKAALKALQAEIRISEAQRKALNQAAQESAVSAVEINLQRQAVK
jgi:hypothetical protein